MMKHDRPEVTTIPTWFSRACYVRMNGNLERFGIIWDDLRLIVSDHDVRINVVTGEIEIQLSRDVCLNKSGGSSGPIVGNRD